MSIRFILPLLAGLWALASNAQPDTALPAISSPLPDSAGVYRDLENALRSPNQVRVLLLTDVDSLPPAIGVLKNLQVLRLEKGSLRHLPVALGELRGLRELHLPGNGLAQLPAWVGRLKGLEVLNLEGNRLMQLPPSVFTLPKLEKLNLSANRFESLPTQIGKLSSLREMNLDRNPLRALPVEIANLKALRHFSAADSHLSMLPESFGKLSKLSSLDLRGATLKSLPESVGDLTNLESLDLGENNLKRLPGSLGKLTTLKKLSLEGNHLTQLPAEMGNLTQLEELNVTGNQLARLPGSLEQLTHLKNLRLGENPLLDVPASLTKHLRDSSNELGGIGVELVLGKGKALLGLQVPGVSQATLAKALPTGNRMQSVHKIELPGVASAGDIPALVNELPHLPADGSGNRAGIAGTPGLPGRHNSPVLPQLPNLPIAAIAAGNMLNLDSARHAWLSVEKKRLREKQVSALRKDVLLKEKESLPSRTFFEGIVGINNRAEAVTLSPAVGVGIIRKASAGLGPVLGLNGRNIGDNISLGIRSFARYELVPKKFNLQLENIGDISRLPSLRLRETGIRRISHTFYAGAGYLINYSGNKSLNLSTLYQLNRDRKSLSLHSPFIFRVGFSAFNRNQK